MGHPAFVAGVAKTMVRLRPLDLIPMPRVLTQTLEAGDPAMQPLEDHLAQKPLSLKWLAFSPVWCRPILLPRVTCAARTLNSLRPPQTLSRDRPDIVIDAVLRLISKIHEQKSVVK
jgi:hypothetical protein